MLAERLHAALIQLSGLRQWGVSSLLGAIGSLAFAPFHLVFVLVPALTGLLWLVTSASSRWTAFAIGWWFGVGHFVAGFYWVGKAFTAADVGVLVGIVGWAIWAYIVYLIGTKLLGTSDTHADWGQLARTIGFAQSPGIFRALGALPTIGDTIFLVASIWILITTVIAVRQALDYTSTLRAVGVVLLGFIPYAIFMSLILVLIGAE